jgi:hypothetical protein
MEQELIALRALLKEAITHGEEAHANECNVWQAPLKDGGLDEQKCNCWLFYATKVVVEAELAEQKKAPVGSCACGHGTKDHSKSGVGFCMGANCECDKFITIQERAA